MSSKDKYIQLRTNFIVITLFTNLRISIIQVNSMGNLTTRILKTNKITTFSKTTTIHFQMKD